MSWVAIVVGVAGAGATAYSAHQAKKASQATGTQREIEGQTLENMRALNPYGLDFLKMGKANMGIYDQFYKTLASGDRNKALALLAPEFRTMDQMAATTAGSAMTLSPRGGGSGERNLQLRDQNQAGKNDTLINLRTDAIDKLGIEGGQQLSLGSTFLGQNAQTGMGLLGAIQSRRNSGFEQARSAGQGMFDILRMLGSTGASAWQNYQARKQATQIPAYSNTLSNVAQYAPGVRS